MRFTPVTHFASGLIEPCVGALASGSVSSSVNLGGVIWDIFVYSASQQAGGAQDTPSQESFNFQITKGTTKRAIVGVIGGGGGGSSDDASGGGGGVNLVQDVTLVEDATYSVYVGYGANGTERINSPGIAFSGTDGAASSFSKDGGGLVINAGGGEGGFKQVDGDNGGSSGTPTSNSATGYGGGGAGAINTGSIGANGVSIWLGDGVQLRAGGGGNFDSNTVQGGYLYGGGDGGTVGTNWCDANSGAGSGGSLINQIRTFGGGGAGGQRYCSADNYYRSSRGGAGAVFIAIPTNLCTGSLYTPKPIVYDSLISYFEMGNPKVVGKQAMGHVVNNLVIGSDILNHVNDLSNINPANSTQLYTNYTGSICSITSQATSSIQSDTSFNGTPGYDFYSGSVQALDTTQPFSVEFIGRDTGTANIAFWGMKNSADVADFLLLGVLQQFKIGTSGSGDVTLQGSYTDADINQHVITYDGSSTVKWYVNGSLNVQNTSAPIPSGISSPILQIGEETNFTAENEIQSFRVYSKELSLSEVETNYCSMDDNCIPFIPPTYEFFNATTSSDYTINYNLDASASLENTPELSFNLWVKNIQLTVPDNNIRLGLSGDATYGFFGIHGTEKGAYPQTVDVSGMYGNIPGPASYPNYLARTLPAYADANSWPSGSEWHMNTFTWQKSSGEMKLYIDGAIYGSASYTSSIDIGNNIVLQSNPSNDDRTMLIGEGLMTGSLLTSSSIANIFTNTKARYGL